MRANPMQQVWWDATPTRRSRRAVLLAVLSLGLLWWLAMKRVREIARRARCEAPPDATLMVPAQGLDGGEIGAEYGRRLQRVVRLCREAPERRLLLAGRSQQAATRGESAAGWRWMREFGLGAQAHVSLDENDGGTEDDLRCAAARMAPGERVAIVSNRYHLARCGVLARRLGLDWSLCAAESAWRGGLCCQFAVAREALALLALCGWRAAFLDSPLLPEPDR
jgi:hypothetical protein